ncbi:hypothetical protein LCGC14_2327030, partial [marine sediment metagenome]
NHIRENSETGIYSRDIQGYDYYKNVFYKNKNGIYLLNSYHNNIYENSFINNSQQAFSDIFSNNFTYNTKGNYWSDYLGKDENSDGIGDQKYQILGRTDLYDSLPFFEVILMEIQPSEWDNIVGAELEPLWKEWIEDPPVPLYKNFMDEAGKAAQAFQGTEGLTETQKRYLKYLQAVNNGVYKPDIAYVQSQNCSTKQVAGYVAPTIGAASDLNIQDANLLRIYVLYGHEPFFDLPESFYNAMGWTSRLTPTGRDAVPASLQDEYTAIVQAGRIPLMATAMVRMQSELRESPWIISRNDPFFNWEDLGVQ